MSEQRSKVTPRKFSVSTLLLSIALVAVIIFTVFTVIDRNNTAALNDDLTATIEDLQMQASEASTKLADNDSTIAALQSELETAKSGSADLTATVESLQSQRTEDSEKLTASNAAVTDLQAQLEAARSEADTKFDALQNEYNAYVQTSETTLADLQQKYDTDMTSAADTLVKTQEDAAAAQALLNARISDLTSTLALLTQASEPGTQDAAVPETDEVEVSDTVSLLAAIRPNRTIHLLPGDYDLSADVVMGLLTGNGSSSFPYVYYNDLKPTQVLNSGVVVANVDNLTIIADSPQEIYTKNHRDTVLVFESCRHVTLSGVTLGHKPYPASACVASVVCTSNCSDVTFSKCDLYGCGVQGAYIENSSSIAFNGSIIRDCTDVAAYVYNGTDIAFVGTEIYGIGTESKYVQTLFQISGDSKNITFNRCNIHDNGNTGTSLRTAMFLVFGNEEALTITDCQMDNNLFDDYIR